MPKRKKIDNDITKRENVWYCYKCGELNYPHHKVCFKGCPVKRPSALSRLLASTPGRSVEPSGINRDQRFSPYSKPSSIFGISSSSNTTRCIKRNDWDCPKCHEHNFGHRNECFTCKAARPGGIPMREGDWWCGWCQSHNFHYRDECYKCSAEKSAGTSKPPSGEYTIMRREKRDWDCPKCQAQCFRSRQECYRCGEPKPPRISEMTFL